MVGRGGQQIGAERQADSHVRPVARAEHRRADQCDLERRDHRDKQRRDPLHDRRDHHDADPVSGAVTDGSRDDRRSDDEDRVDEDEQQQVILCPRRVPSEPVHEEEEQEPGAERVADVDDEAPREQPGEVAITQCSEPIAQATRRAGPAESAGAGGSGSSRAAVTPTTAKKAASTR